MLIRYLTPADVTSYRSLRLFSLSESPFAFSDSYEDQENKSLAEFQSEITMTGNPPEAFALGAFTETEELTGFVKFKRDHRSKARHRASLHSLYVKPAHRGKGIAGELVSELLRIAATLPGVEQVRLWTIIPEVSLVAFYEKFGFEKSGGLIENDLIINGRYVHAWYMVNYLKTTT